MKKESISPLQGSDVTFNHKTYVGEHGEVLYDMPLDAEDIDLKDFNATGFVTDRTFMTNADTPSLAFAGTVTDPVNPFTGNPINSDRKNEGPIVLMNTKIDVDAEKDTVYDNEVVSWYSVHDNIFDRADWERLRVGVDMEE